MVSSPGGVSGSQYAPQNEKARLGTIKYLNQGAGAVIDARREDAYKQMFTACNGKYNIVSEGPRTEGGDLDEYWYIRFECAGASAPRDTASEK
jgi:hypothetical protein